MNSTTVAEAGAQMSMPGMPSHAPGPRVMDWLTMAPGREVLYLGKVSGGPRFGSRGIVKKALKSKAVVDLGRSGTWHIPYYFLRLPQAA